MIVFWSLNDCFDNKSNYIPLDDRKKKEIDNMIFKLKCWTGTLAVVGFGNAKNWRASPEFDNLASSLKEKLQNYGIPVIDPHRVYETMGRRDAWHFSKSDENKLAMAKVANGVINFVQALQARRL